VGEVRHLTVRGLLDTLKAIVDLGDVVDKAGVLWEGLVLDLASVWLVGDLRDRSLLRDADT